MNLQPATIPTHLKGGFFGVAQEQEKHIQCQKCWHNFRKHIARKVSWHF